MNPRLPWSWRMAWRDSRGEGRRLLLLVLAIAVGVGALVAVQGFARAVRSAAATQAKAMLGADLAVSAPRPFSPELERALAATPGQRASEWSFGTMVYFVRQDASRLAAVRALSPEGYPWYGEIATDPPQAARTFLATGGALVDDALLRQFDARPGDEIRLGNASFTVAGRLLQAPGQTEFEAQLAPRLYIPLARVPETGLLRFGSRTRYAVYCQLPPGSDPERERERLAKVAGDDDGVRVHTAASRAERLGESLANLQSFLSLAALMALVLGGIGVGSAVHLYMQRQTGAIATLRCLGATRGQVLAVYLTQTLALGTLGALAGLALGLLLQRALPLALGSFLPLRLDTQANLADLALALGGGLGMTLLFTLRPLAGLRRIAPLRALRRDFEDGNLPPDPWRWGIWLLLGAGIAAFAIVGSGSWRHGLAVAGGIAAALVLLAGLGALLAWSARRFLPARWPYVWRQGLQNLARPRNQTTLLMVCLGLGAFLLVGLQLVESALLAQFERIRAGNRPNIVFFDVQPDQRLPLAGLLREQGAPLLEEAPIVTMRLTAVKGRPVAALRQPPGHAASGGISPWALNREYRSSYRATLKSSEKLIAGTWIGQAPADAAAPIPVALEEGIAKTLHVGLGDELEFDVQGIGIKTRVASLRQVQWYRIEPNFFVLFPAGVLEDAPQTWVLVSHAADAAQSAALQRESVRRFANVSVIDLGLVLNTANRVLARMSLAVRFLSLFSLAAGALVLFSSLSMTRWQRERESRLLRLLGASRRQILGILVVEFLALGSLAAAAGVLLAVAGSWAVVTRLFAAPYSISWPTLCLAWLAVCALTLAAGLLNGLSLLRPRAVNSEP